MAQAQKGKKQSALHNNFLMIQKKLQSQKEPTEEDFNLKRGNTVLFLKTIEKDK